MLPQDATWEPKVCKNIFAAGTPLWPCWGSLQCCPDLIVGFYSWGRKGKEGGREGKVKPPLLRPHKIFGATPWTSSLKVFKILYIFLRLYSFLKEYVTSWKFRSLVDEVLKVLKLKFLQMIVTAVWKLSYDANGKVCEFFPPKLRSPCLDQGVFFHGFNWVEPVKKPMQRNIRS